MQTLSKYKDFAHSRRLKKTKEEYLFYPALHKLRDEFNLKIKNEYVIRPYVIDFYIPKLGIAIEIDGGYHNDRIEYDSMRNSYLEERDIIVLRFDNEMINNHLSWVLDTMRNAILKRINYNFNNHKACESNCN